MADELTNPSTDYSDKPFGAHTSKRVGIVIPIGTDSEQETSCAACQYSYSYGDYQAEGLYFCTKHRKKVTANSFCGDFKSSPKNTSEAEKVNPSKDQPRCPYCGSTNVYGISRVVGYFSMIDNWNKSKKAELQRRKKGNYWSDEQ